MIKLLGFTNRIKKGGILLLLLGLIIIAGCKKDKDPVFDPGTNEFINDWVLDSMKVYYYWNTTLPKKPDYNQDPLRFFASIKNNADRFSQLLNADVPESYPRSLYSDFGVDLVNITASGSDQTLVRLSVPGSDGYVAGLRRGDKVTAINGVAVNSSNIGSLSESSLKRGSIVLQVEGVAAAYNINGYLKPNPVYTTQIWEKGNKKIGYIFLNNFDTKALNRLKEVFAGFKAQQVNELILDMRYNTGGEVSVAAALAAMITRANEDAIFLEYRGNANAGTQRHTFGEEITKLFRPLNYSQYTNLRLDINRLFILTGKHTASAAELLINNLTPHFPTVRIGEATLGKDMAEFELADHRTPPQVKGWVLWPLVFKVYNAQGQGNYTAGLPPDVLSDELAVLPLKQLGDPEETLTQLAISRITGVAKLGIRSSLARENQRKMFDSRDKDDLSVIPIRVTR
ncbi:S41 family peptidase [Pedobacter sp. UBA5917]|uniref:S41 family peptidase n=1 Tax=Pedobacter sp. UBA5917 TaxID=1947061 RepID=UPI0025DAED6B|nr:S41 family peptidase [Pedobacter sp. UBA5917]